MRLATALIDGLPQLLIERPAGWLLIEAARAVTGDGVPRATEVAALYRAGPSLVERVARLTDDPRLDALPHYPLHTYSLAPIVTSPRVIMCVGRNYMEHIREGAAPVPERPILFAKFPNTLIGHKAPVVAHAIARTLDYEGELAVIIGRRASQVRAATWLDVVAGYTIINDISDRDLQNGDVQWIRGKSLDTWAPLGPVFVSADEIPDPHDLRIRTRVNGELRQDASTGDMLFRIPQLIEFITEAITLEPGDIIATGTPSGVGLGFDPPKWLQPGDSVDVNIEPIGTLISRIEAPDAA